MGIGGQREGAEASVEKQYAHTNVIDTLEGCMYLKEQLGERMACLLKIDVKLVLKVKHQMEWSRQKHIVWKN